MADAPTIILAIENSNPSSEHGDGDGPGVALGRISPGAAGPDVQGVEFLKPTGRHDDDLMSAIDRLTRRRGIDPAQIGRIAVSVGPGGYTALRIAIASAKMIAEVTGARTVAVPTAQVAARLVSARAGEGRFAVALASKGVSAYLTVFGPDGRAQDEGWVGTGADLSRIASGEDPVRALIADRFIADSFRKIVEEAGLLWEPIRFHPVACLEVACSRLPGDPMALSPLYAREPEAVTLWRTRKS